MNIKELKEFLKNIPDDYEVKVANAYLQEEYELDEGSIILYEDEKTLMFLD